MLTAFKTGVDAALQACRRAQMEKQLEVLELGLRGLSADLKKFSHIPEIASQIEATINSVTATMDLLKGDNSPEMYLEDNIDVEQRHKGETPLEFSLKQQINQVYKERYLPLIEVYTLEKNRKLVELENARLAKLKEAKSKYTGTLKSIDIHKASEKEIEALDAQWQFTISGINKKHDQLREAAIVDLKQKHKAELEAAKPIYDAQIAPLVKQLQVEIASKLFNVSIRSLKQIFDEDKLQGLSLDVNSLTFYAMLSQSLDKLGKLDIVNSIGLPAINDIVRKQIPVAERELSASSISDRILESLAETAGVSAGVVIGDIVDASYRRLEDAVEISEQNAALIIPEANIDIPFMAYHLPTSNPKASQNAPESLPMNFFQAIDAVSKANGVVDKMGALKGFYQAMTSGSAEGCLDESENVFDSMNQGLICELMRQRYSILHYVGDALSKMGEIPKDWQDFSDTLSNVEKDKNVLDSDFSELNKKYSLFKGEFDLIKKDYDASVRAYEAEKTKHLGSSYVQLENEKARRLIDKAAKIKKKLDGKYRAKLNAKIIKAQNEAYEKKYNLFKRITSSDKKIAQYFTDHPDADLNQQIKKITLEHNKKLNVLVKRKSEEAAEKLDKQYASRIEVALTALDKLQRLEAVCKRHRNAMAEKSREFYKEVQAFNKQREAFNEAVNFALGKMEKLNIPEGGKHLWQLQTLANWSVDELAPLDIVVSLLSTVGDKIKASAVSYSDVFELVASEQKRKMKAETARGGEASASDKIKQGVGNMIGSSIVELKAGEQMGYLRCFADNIACTIATEERVASIVTGYQANDLAVKHAALTYTPTPLAAESKGRLAQFFADLAMFFEALNPFVSRVDLDAKVNAGASPPILSAARTRAKSVKNTNKSMTAEQKPFQTHKKGTL